MPTCPKSFGKCCIYFSFFIIIFNFQISNSKLTLTRAKLTKFLENLNSSFQLNFLTLFSKQSIQCLDLWLGINPLTCYIFSHNQISIWAGEHALDLRLSARRCTLLHSGDSNNECWYNYPTCEPVLGWSQATVSSTMGTPHARVYAH